MNPQRSPPPPFVQWLQRRDELLRQTREFFRQREFIEVQVPCLSRDCVVDAHLDPIAVPAKELGIASSGPRSPQAFFLQTSPESALKRLLARGAPSLFTIMPAFRRGEAGIRHNIEFTMLEWYELDADMNGGVTTLSELAQALLNKPRCEIVRYRELFQRELGLDPIACPLAELRNLVQLVDGELAESLANDRDGMLDVVFTHRIEPSMGADVPIIVTHYPKSQAALAKLAKDDPETACRFELFYRGFEIANGYDELLDADELQHRYRQANTQRELTGRAPLNIKTTLVEAMRVGLPPCSGVALGIDRMLMAKHGAENIDEVMPFTTETA